MGSPALKEEALLTLHTVRKINPEPHMMGLILLGAERLPDPLSPIGSHHARSLEHLAGMGPKRFDSFSWLMVCHFLLQGALSTHNLSYWQGSQYIGVGPGEFPGKVRGTRDLTRWGCV